MFFKIAQKLEQIFELLLEEHVLARTLKNRPIWSHWLAGAIYESKFEWIIILSFFTGQSVVFSPFQLNHSNFTLRQTRASKILWKSFSHLGSGTLRRSHRSGLDSFLHVLLPTYLYMSGDISYYLYILPTCTCLDIFSIYLYMFPTYYLLVHVWRYFLLLVHVLYLLPTYLYMSGDISYYLYIFYTYILPSCTCLDIFSTYLYMFPTYFLPSCTCLGIFLHLLPVCSKWFFYKPPLAS